MKYVQNTETPAPVLNENGRIGYIIAWLMGVPASILFLIFLVRGH